jgi:hypothetical protein
MHFSFMYCSRDTSMLSYALDRLFASIRVRFRGTMVGPSSNEMQTGTPLANQPYPAVARLLLEALYGDDSPGVESRPSMHAYTACAFA